ncbi:MAG: hypothetical protein H0X26_08625 [Alphaproteobacteria bacterium]|nr:hypothetical protein [Alphaproteobacteria bacterium]
MLKIINPKGQKLHQFTVESFLDLLKVYQNFELSPEQKKKATFLIAENEAHGIYSGAVLYSENISDVTDCSKDETYEEKFCNLFSAFQGSELKCWRARIFFCLETSSTPEGQTGVELSQSFYRDLYEAFLVFGNSKDIEFIALTSFSFDTMNPPFYKKWPRCMPVKFSYTTDGLKHGILSLRGKKFMPDWRKLSSLDTLNGAEESPYGRAA